MNTKLISQNGLAYIECWGGDGFLLGEEQALELVAACGEGGTSHLMIHTDAIPNAFYRLHSGVAGAVLQKLSNYRIRTAFILTPELVNQGRFREWVIESNRGNQFRVYYERDQAEAWLLQ